MVDRSGAQSAAVNSWVELQGVELIPDEDKQSDPKDLFFVFFGSQMCFAIIILGSLPIVFGLGFWDALGAITTGLLIGSLFFALLAPFGMRTGTSASLATASHFGLRGKAIGTFIATFTALGCYALTVWTGGEAVAAGVARLLGWEMSQHLLALGAVAICGMTILAAIFGHAIIVATEKMVSYGAAIVLVIVALTLLPDFEPEYAGGEYLLGSYWPTWFLAMTICAAIPVSYATWLNDYTRYLRPGTSPSKAMWAAGGGMFIGCWLSLNFAAAVMTMLQSPDTPFVTGLIGLVAWWAALLLALVGVIGSQPQGSLLLYGAGLGVQSLFPSLTRISATIMLSIFGLALVFGGIYVVDMLGMVAAFLVVDQCVIAPWLAIHLVGYCFVMKGRYKPQDLFIPVSHGGGSYWYHRGWNVNALVAWLIGVGTGLMFVNTEYFQGPLSTLVGGISLDWIVAGAAGGLIYYVLERLSRRTAPTAFFPAS